LLEVAETFRDMRSTFNIRGRRTGKEKGKIGLREIRKVSGVRNIYKSFMRSAGAAV
jgi:hypothetical protein